MEGNLISNGDFSNGTTDWYVAGSTNLSVNNSSQAEVSVSNSGGSPNQLYQYGIPLVKDKKYILRMKGKVDSGTKSLSALMIQHSDPYGVLSEHINFTLTETMTEYSQVFTALETESNSRIRIFFDNTGTYTLDDFILEEYIEDDSCSLFPQGDATCDGVVNSTDYVCWKTQFITVLNGGTPSAANDCRVSDFNEDNTVNLLDFVLWRKG